MPDESACPEGPAGRPWRLEVIGCGNPLAGDDGAGIEFVERLQSAGPLNGCRYTTSRDGGVALLDLFEHSDAILFVDAVVSGAAPGTLHLVPLPTTTLQPRGLAGFSTHGWGLKETLELAQTLGRRVPPVHLLGIEIESSQPGQERSPSVDAAIQEAVHLFPLLRELLSRR